MPPPSDLPARHESKRPSFLYFEVEEIQKRAWLQAAQVRKLTVQDWVTQALNAQAHDDLKTIHEP